MKSKMFLVGTMLSLGLSYCYVTNAQSLGHVKQIIAVNSGKFEYAPPYMNYVIVQTYNPRSDSVTLFNTISTQSAQSVVIAGKMAYVTA
jgi:hypothetical protein